IELFGCRFVGKTNCNAALTVVRQYHPDLILMDILMPEQDGISFVRHLRQNITTCQIPIIAVTALARAEDREAILLSGFTDYLSKPYLLDDLEVLVRQHLGQEMQLPAPV
ncbi:MAG TPA: response regulator, partial [Allocoleopsis sp.]